MTEDDVVRIVRAYIEGLFPRVCPTCGRRFDSLREYLENTTHLDIPIVYDKLDAGIPPDMLGPMSMANCRCGNTLTISSIEMPQPMLVELITWGVSEVTRRGISLRELLREIRDRIDAQVLSSVG